MFRKILIAFVLLATLAGLSYVKTAREHSRQDEIYKQAKTDIATETKTAKENFVNKIDSLGDKIVSSKNLFTQSISTQKKSYETQLDSLENIIDNQSAKITELSKRPVKKSQTASKAKVKTKQLSQHEKVFRYYKKRYTSLPSDLSTYEKKIALSEIRDDTATKFSISLNELTKIRKEYKLNY